MSPGARSKVQLPRGNRDLPEICILLQLSSNALFFSLLDALKRLSKSFITDCLALTQPKGDCIGSGGWNFTARKMRSSQWRLQSQPTFVVALPILYPQKSLKWVSEWVCVCVYKYVQMKVLCLYYKKLRQRLGKKYQKKSSCVTSQGKGKPVFSLPRLPYIPKRRNH